MFQFASEDTFGAFLTKFTAKEHCAYLLFNLFNSQYFKTKIKSIACGTGINNLTNLTFDEIYIVMPEDKLLLEFDKRQSQIFAEIGLIEKSNVELTKQRDELLPLLMNGQATINYHLCVFPNKQNLSFLCIEKFKTMTDFDYHDLRFTSVNGLSGVHGAVVFRVRLARRFFANKGR